MKFTTSLTLLAVVTSSIIVVCSVSAAAAHNHHEEAINHNFRIFKHHYGQDAASCTFNTVDLRPHHPGVLDDLALTITAAAGLMNRYGPHVYLIRSATDVNWIPTLIGSACTAVPQQAEALLIREFAKPQSFLKNVILFNRSRHELFPSVVTMCGVLDAVPFDSQRWVNIWRSDPAAFKNAKVVLDTTSYRNSAGAWASAQAAVNYTVEHALQQTNSFSFSSGSDLKAGGSADWIVFKKLFASYLNNSCQAGNEDNKIFRKIVEDSPWPRPVGGYGYNSQDSWKTAGGTVIAYPYEANTLCSNVTGEICTMDSYNLAFWSMWKPFNTSAPRGSTTGPLVQPGKRQNLNYDPEKIYVAPLVMDGDNIMFEQTFTRERYEYRVQRCLQNMSRCFPLSWTISPQMFSFSPQMMRYYYSLAEKIGDTMVMSPGGLMYGYPAMWPQDVQEKYVPQMNAFADLMDVDATSDWEWFFDWGAALEKNPAQGYYAKFAQKQKQQRRRRISTFLLNAVPWPVGVLPMILENEYVRMFHAGNSSSSNDHDDDVVLAFRAALNMAYAGGGGFNLTGAEAAHWLNTLVPKGTTSYLYFTRNGKIDLLFDMYDALGVDSPVVLVGMADLRSLALQRAKHISNQKKIQKEAGKK